MKRYLTIIIIMLACMAVLTACTNPALDNPGTDHKVVQEEKGESGAPDSLTDADIEAAMIRRIAGDGSLGDSRGGTSGHWEYTITDQGFAVLRKYVGNDTEVVVPATLDGRPVLAINSAFYGNQTVRSIVMEEGIAIVDGMSFSGCTALETLVVPKSVVYFRPSALDETPWYGRQFENEEFVVLGSVLMKVQVDCRQSGITLDIPDGVATTASFCGPDYWGGEGLRVNFPASLRYIEGNSLTWLEAAAEWTLPDGVVAIGNHAIGLDKSVESFDFPRSLLAFQASAISSTDIKRITLYDGVTSIPDYAFAEHPYLEEVTIPASVTEIGESLFYYGQQFGGYTIRVDKYPQPVIKGEPGSCAEDWARENPEFCGGFQGIG